MTTYRFSTVVEPDEDQWYPIARLSSRRTAPPGVKLAISYVYLWLRYL